MEQQISKKVPIDQAAKEIGCSAQTVRGKMYTGEWDLGAVSRNKGGTIRAHYYVFRAKLDKFLGEGGGEENCEK